MGCRVDHGPQEITVTGGALKAVTVDMADMPDMVPTLAVVAAFADGRIFSGQTAESNGFVEVWNLDELTSEQAAYGAWLVATPTAERRARSSSRATCRATRSSSGRGSRTSGTGPGESCRR